MVAELGVGSVWGMSISRLKAGAGKISENVQHAAVNTWFRCLAVKALPITDRMRGKKKF